MPERGRTLKIPWIYFLGRNTPSPSAHPSQGWRTITITGTLDPESAQPAPHIPMAQHCSEPSLTPQSFTEELQFFLQAEKQTWTPRAGPEPPSHCLVTSTLLQPGDHSVDSKKRFQTPFLVSSRMVLLFLLPESSQQHLHRSARPSHQEIFQRAPGD